MKQASVELENSNETNDEPDEQIKAIDIVLEHKKIIERDIWSLEYKIEERKELLEKINEFMQQECEHEYVFDFIDSIKNYHKGSQKIIYCKKCELIKPLKNFNSNTSNNKDD